MSFFSPKQVVTIVVTVCLTVVLLPASVWAASSASKVELFDGSGRVAQVDASGRLQIVGAVTAQAPGTAFHVELSVSGSRAPVDPPVIWSGTGSKRLDLTSLAETLTDPHATSDAPSYAVSALSILTIPTKDSCDSHALGRGAAALTLDSFHTAELTYPSPWVISASSGKKVCLEWIYGLPNSDSSTILDVIGYTTG